MIPRSYLFVPGDRPERFAKAHAASPDAVIFDLEDAVAPAAKSTARRCLSEWLTATSHDTALRPVVVRTNAIDTEWFRDDLEICRLPAVQAIMVPKAERVDDLARVATASGKRVLALIETALGFDNLRTLAQATGVERLAFGSIDFQLDMGIRGDGEELLAFRSQLVLASRIAGLAPPIDGVSTEISDPASVRTDAQRARRLGFGAKLCIHPTQIEAVNLSFSPSSEELAWAQRVLHAAKAAGGAAVAVDGKMVDRPVILRAESLLRQAADAA